MAEKRKDAKSMSRSLTACVLLALCLCGCTPSGYVVESGNSNLTQFNISQIEKGKTTKQQILNRFGQPQFKTNSGILGDMWTYSRSTQKYYSKNFFSGTEVSGTTSSLCVVFDGDVVKDFSTSEMNPYQPVTLQRF